MKKGIITFNTEHELATLIENVPEKNEKQSDVYQCAAGFGRTRKEGPEFRELLRKARNRDKEWVAVKNTKKAKVLVLLEGSGSICDRHL